MKLWDADHHFRTTKSWHLIGKKIIQEMRDKEGGDRMNREWKLMIKEVVDENHWNRMSWPQILPFASGVLFFFFFYWDVELCLIVSRSVDSRSHSFFFLSLWKDGISYYYFFRVKNRLVRSSHFFSIWKFCLFWALLWEIDSIRTFLLQMCDFRAFWIKIL